MRIMPHKTHWHAFAQTMQSIICTQYRTAHLLQTRRIIRHFQTANNTDTVEAAAAAAASYQRAPLTANYAHTQRRLKRMRRNTIPDARFTIKHTWSYGWWCCCTSISDCNNSFVACVESYGEHRRSCFSTISDYTKSSAWHCPKQKYHFHFYCVLVFVAMPTISHQIEIDWLRCIALGHNSQPISHGTNGNHHLPMVIIIIVHTTHCAKCFTTFGFDSYASWLSLVPIRFAHQTHFATSEVR